MEDFIGGGLIDPKVLLGGGVLRNDRAEDRGHGQNDQESDGEAQGGKGFPERRDQVFIRFAGQGLPQKKTGVEFGPTPAKNISETRGSCKTLERTRNRSSGSRRADGGFDFCRSL